LNAIPLRYVMQQECGRAEQKAGDQREDHGPQSQPET